MRMRRVLGLVTLAVVVLGVASCDLFQPTKVDTLKNGKPWHADLVNIKGTKGDDELAAYDQHNVQVRSFAGNDTIDLTEAGGQNYVDAGSGDDYVIDSPFYDTIRLGDGNDVATHTGGNDITAGDRDSDFFEIYVDQVITAPDPPYDVGGPLVTRIDGGDGEDTARFIMTQERVDAGYAEAITEAFLDWWQQDPTGELDLNVATGILDPPLNIILADIEALEMVNSTTNTTHVYP